MKKTHDTIADGDDTTSFLESYDFGIKKGRTFKGMKISWDEYSPDKEYALRISIAKGIDPDIEISTKSEGSKLIRHENGIEPFISAKDTANLDGDYEYEIVEIDGDEVDDVFSGNITTKYGIK